MYKGSNAQLIRDVCFLVPQDLLIFFSIANYIILQTTTRLVVIICCTSAKTASKLREKMLQCGCTCNIQSTVCY